MNERNNPNGRTQGHSYDAVSATRQRGWRYRTRKGLLRIVESKEHPGFWDLFLNHQLIRPDYHDPWEAADCASRSDFGDEELDELLKYQSVSADLESWYQIWN